LPDLLYSGYILKLPNIEKEQTQMKRIIGAVLAVMLILSAAACSAPATESTTLTTDEPSVTSGTVTTSAPVTTSESTPAPASVVFNDSVLEQLVREQMHKPEGAITLTEAEAVEYLDLKEYEPSTPSARIKDISALQYFKNLKGLDISYQSVEDLSPLAGLVKLEGFNYWGAEQCTDFSALANMVNMLDITIAGTQGDGIKFNDADMQSLAGMINIEMLWIQGAKALTDISVVTNFNRLYRLNLDYCGISDISPVASVTSLVEMDLRGSQVSDVSPLKTLTNLKTLYLEGCPVSDYSPLQDIYPQLENKDFTLE
jgi:Leucine-rich repeat (LRR) protein